MTTNSNQAPREGWIARDGTDERSEPARVPFDKALNAAVVHIAARLNPGGFDVLADQRDAPDSLPALNAYVRAHRRIGVWGGASEKTIFADAEVNAAFRAWHDWAHWRGQFPFTPEGERKAARLQVAQLVQTYGDTPRTREWAALVLCEVVGQAEALKADGAFPEDQAAFDRDNVKRFRAEAAELCAHYAGVYGASTLPVDLPLAA